MSLYRPTKLKVTSLGINISDKTRETEFCDVNQYLIVGEKYINSSNIYSFIVDDEGVAINTSLPDRSANKNKYALYVQGDIYSTGSIFASNVQGGNGGFNTNTLSNLFIGWISSNTSNGIIITDSVFKLANGETDNIYYTGRMTLGNENTARGNTYSINVVQSADINVNKSQLSLRNLKDAQIRMGIIGDGTTSPAILNTPTTTPLEIHVGRGQDYFKHAYSNVYRDPNTGGFITQILNTPNYTTTQYWTGAAPPDVLVDTSGHVGINTSVCPPITYDYITSVNGYQVLSKTSSMKLHVDGPLYGRDILINDPLTNKPVNIERYFTKISADPTYDATSIIPGRFLDGPNGFYFDGPLGVNGTRIYNPDTGKLFALTVNGDAYIDNNAVLNGNAHFYQDLQVDNDVVVGKDLKLLTGGIVVPVSEGGQTVYKQVIFSFSNNFAYSNINPFGTGATTPGVFGVGFDPYYDSMYNQLVVNKRNSNIFELELTDHTTPYLRKYAVLGHINPYNRQDGSFIIATGTQTPNQSPGGINLNTKPIPQNIFFYPGGIQTYNSYSRIDPACNVAALSLIEGNRAGINTSSPQLDATLDVNGKLYVSDEIYTLSHVSSNYYPVAHWFAVSEGDPLPSPYSSAAGFVDGIMYYEPSAAHVGVNVAPSSNYGMVVAGGLKSIGGYFTADDRRVVVWYDSGDYTANIAPPDSDKQKQMFTYQRVGMGIKQPQGTLDLQSQLTSVPTSINLYNTASYSNININLNGSYGTYQLQAIPDAYNMYMSYNPNYVSKSDDGIQIRYNPNMKRHQIVLGAKGDVFNYPSSNNPNKNAILTVDGDATILGNLTITGYYRTSNTTVVINPDNTVTQIPLILEDEVYIGGGNIFMKSQGVITMGYDGNDDQNVLRNPNSILKIKSAINTINNPNSYYALLLEGLYSSLIGFKLNNSYAEDNKLLQIGLTKQTVNDNPAFIIYDAEISKHILYSKRQGSYYYTGLNLTNGDNSTALFEIKTILSENSLQNMLRLTYTGLQTDEKSPEFDFHIYDINQNVHTTWFFHGPDSKYNQKFAIKYVRNTGTTLNKSDATEVLTLDNTGKLGIGQPEPKYGIDLKGVGDSASLRLYSTSTTEGPQIVFQTGGATFGEDSAVDYAFKVENKNFKLYQQTVNNPLTILSVLQGAYGTQVGILTDNITTKYAVTIKGSLNLVDGNIYLNGNLLITTFGPTNIFTGDNIFLSPSLNTGIVIKAGLTSSTINPTNNLFDIICQQGDYNGMVVESDINDVQVQTHLRTHYAGNAPVYRTQLNQVNYELWYNPNVSTPKISSANTGYTQINSIHPSGNVNVFTMEMYNELHIKTQNALLSLETATGTNPIQFQNDGTGNLLLNLTRSVGIGTTTIPNALVDINDPSYSITNNLLSVGPSNSGFIVSRTGYTGIGTSVPQYPLHVGFSNNYAQQDYSRVITRIDGSAFIQGNLTINASLETYNNPISGSDSNIKKDIVRIENALDKIQKLQGYTFTMKESEQRSTGLIAQEVQEVLPEAVQKRSDGYLGLAYGSMMGLVVEAIRDLANDIKDIKAKLGMNS
jgi:hypothetical protein